MTRVWKEFALGLLLGTWLLAVNCTARAQEQQEVASSARKGASPNATSNAAEANPDTDAHSSVPDATPSPGEYDNRLGLQLLKHIAQDQKAVFLAPAKAHLVDLDWLVPLGGATAAMIATDADFSRHLSSSPNRIKYSKDLGNYGVASLVGVGGGLYLWGQITHDDHKSETGLLAGEAAIDSLALTYGIKYATRRERPYQDGGAGLFWHGGDSFPSEHAAAAWSIASVIAHEYPGPLTSLLAYGMASAISASRLTAKQHYPSDVLVGSAIGWLEGMYVYRKHHDPTIGGGEWQTYDEMQDTSPAHDNSGNLGSPYVPLDSWIYPAFERLAGMGLLDDEFLGMRPWTRRECARLLQEVTGGEPATYQDKPEVAQLVDALQREFHAELDPTWNNSGFRLESVYSRTEYISGMPLTDGYELAQTQYNDFGRPFGEGWNTVNGFSAYGTAGRWVTYVRAEEQTAPSIPALPLSARQGIEQSYQNIDGIFLPLHPGTPQPAFDQFTLLEGYVGTTVSNFEVSFGRQALWWGPGDGGSLDMSDNAQPIDMFRINRTVPLKLPWILGWLGPMRAEFFLGRLAGFDFIDTPNTGLVGQQWGQPLADQPFIHGEYIGFRPTRNFEFAFYRTTIFGGAGYPFTFHTFVRSLVTTANSNRGTTDKPGNRTSGLNFSYRLPGVRDWVSFYGDGYTDDQFSPIAYADRSSWHAGLFFSHFPKLAHLDLRVEGIYTDVPPGLGPIAPGAFYANGTWTSGYTNNGNLIGSWVGRGGQGAQAWTNYWFNARNRLQFNFRHQKVSQMYLSGGGSLTDIGVRSDYWVRSNLSLSASVQYERWLFPVIQPGQNTDVSATVEILFQPEKLFGHSSSSSAAAVSPEKGDQP